MKANEYEVIVEDCRNSGLTIREYSERIGVSVHTLHTWIRRTRKRYGITSDKKEYEVYRALVIAGKTSGKTAKEWCADQGINYLTFRGWVKKVNRKEGREKIDRICGIDRTPHGRQPEPKVTANPTLCEVRR